MQNKHAYLILAHSQWEVLKTLLVLLDDERNDIYLHIDKKVGDFPRNDLNNQIKSSSLYFVRRNNLVWGGTQMIECTLQMLREASKIGYEYYHLISGVDLPLKTQDEMHTFFSANSGMQYIGFDHKSYETKSFMFRVQFYHLGANYLGRKSSTKLSGRILLHLDDLSLSIQQKLHVNRIGNDTKSIYKGSSWFSITHDLVKEIVSNENKILKKYKFTLGADEIWLQTFITNSEFARQIADSNMRYIKWIQGNPSPETLTMADYEDLIASDKLFARKFDWNRDSKVVMKLKEHIIKG